MKEEEETKTAEEEDEEDNFENDSIWMAEHPDNDS